MAEWVYVENNEIKGYYDALPYHWQNSLGSHIGFNLSVNNLPWLKEQGWLPVRKEYQNYDSNTSRVSGYHYEIHDDHVIESLILETIPSPTEEEISNVKNILLNDLRFRRDRLLKESDWTQLPDVQSSFDDETKEKWLQYRQTLRDLPSIYATNDILDINQIIWPRV